jgi:hypothetical protein
MENQLWDTIIQSLQGTCDTLYSVLEYYDATHLEDDLQFLDYLDNQIFLCSSCNWWFEISEESGIDEHELICNYCAEEYGE